MTTRTTLSEDAGYTVTNDGGTVTIVTTTETWKGPFTRTATLSTAAFLGALAHGFDIIPTGVSASAPGDGFSGEDGVYTFDATPDTAIATVVPAPKVTVRGSDLVIQPTTEAATVVIAALDDPTISEVIIPAAELMAALGVGFIDVSGHLTRHIAPPLPPFYVYADRSTKLVEEVAL